MHSEIRDRGIFYVASRWEENGITSGYLCNPETTDHIAICISNFIPILIKGKCPWFPFLILRVFLQRQECRTLFLSWHAPRPSQFDMGRIIGWEKGQIAVGAVRL